MAKKKINLFMAKAEHSDFLDVLSDSGRSAIKSGKATRHQPSNFPNPAELFVFRSVPKAPGWLSDLASHFNGVATTHRNSSIAALLCFNTEKSTFIISYGYGWIYIDDSKLVQDFGLMALVNLSDDKEIKNVEKANLGVALRGFTQTASKGSLQDLGFEETLDIVRKLTALSGGGDLGEQASGANSLKLTLDIELKKVIDTAKSAKKLSQSDAYKKTGFQVIDFLRPISDVTVIEKLNDRLIGSLINKKSEFELTTPQILADDYGYIKIAGAGGGVKYPVVNIQIYQDALGSVLTKLDIDMLKRHRVEIYGDNDEHPLNRWMVYRCLVGSIDHNGRQYALNEGQWYSVDDAFKNGAISAYNTRKLPLSAEFGPLVKIADKKKGGSYSLEREEEYLMRTAATAGFLLMDQKLVGLAGATKGAGIEVCDMIDLAGRRLIHVKKGSTNSSVLSHFFRQGFNSAQFLRMSAQFRDAVRDKIAEFDAASASQFHATINDGNKWTVEFRIADSIRASSDHDIPFFSKMSFRDVAEKGETMSFDFRIGYINVPK